MITKKEFQRYEEVRASGRTNMLKVWAVSELSGLSKKKVMDIMENYSKLTKKYPGVRVKP